MKKIFILFLSINIFLFSGCNVNSQYDTITEFQNTVINALNHSLILEIGEDIYYPKTLKGGFELIKRNGNKEQSLFQISSSVPEWLFFYDNSIILYSSPKIYSYNLEKKELIERFEINGIIKYMCFDEHTLYYIDQEGMFGYFDFQKVNTLNASFKQRVNI